MKAIYHGFQTGETRIVPMEPVDDAYFGADDFGSGYRVPASLDFVTDNGDGEYFGMHVAMSVYEGAEAAGSYPTFSWAIIPESLDEAKHLNEICGRVLYRV